MCKQTSGLSKEVPKHKRQSFLVLVAYLFLFTLTPGKPREANHFVTAARDNFLKMQTNVEKGKDHSSWLSGP